MVDLRCWHCKKLLGQLLRFGANSIFRLDIRNWGEDKDGHLLCDDCLDKKEKEGATVFRKRK